MGVSKLVHLKLVLSLDHEIDGLALVAILRRKLKEVQVLLGEVGLGGMLR